MTEISSVRIAREIQMLGENMKYFKAGNKTIVLTAENCPSNCSAWTGKTSHLGPHNFEDPITLWDESHDQFRVYMCNTCETCFLWHWHEEIGWDGGGDSTSITLKSLRSADLIAIKYFQEHAPTHASYGNYLKARIMDW